VNDDRLVQDVFGAVDIFCLCFTCDETVIYVTILKSFKTISCALHRHKLTRLSGRCLQRTTRKAGTCVTYVSVECSVRWDRPRVAGALNVAVPTAFGSRSVTATTWTDATLPQRSFKITQI